MKSPWRYPLAHHVVPDMHVRDPRSGKPVKVIGRKDVYSASGQRISILLDLGDDVVIDAHPNATVGVWEDPAWTDGDVEEIATAIGGER